MCAAQAAAAPGDLDRTFGGDGRVVTNLTGSSDSVADVAIQANGRIVVVGRTVGRRYGKFALARYRPDGRLDPTFHGDGKVITNFTRWDDSASDVAIRPDGKIVAVGVAGYSWDTVATFAVVRYEPEGTLDGSFGDHGKLRTRFRARIPDDPVGIVGAWATGVAIVADGRIVAAGGVDRTVDGHLDGRFALVRYRVGRRVPSRAISSDPRL